MGRLRGTTSSPARPTTATEPRSRGERRDESIIACTCGPCIPAGLPLSPLARCTLLCRPRASDRVVTRVRWSLSVCYRRVQFTVTHMDCVGTECLFQRASLTDQRRQG